MTDTTTEAAPGAPAVELNPLKVAVHDFTTMLEGKSTFDQFMADEGATLKADIAKLPAVVQGAASLAMTSFEDGASVLVGAGQTALGALLANTPDTLATMVQNLAGSAGINLGGGVLSVAEHAALTTLVNGLKTGLDRTLLHTTTTLGVSAGS